MSQVARCRSLVDQLKSIWTQSEEHCTVPPEELFDEAAKNVHFLPKPYADRYAGRLLHTRESLRRLHSAPEEWYIIEALCNAISQRNPDFPHREALGEFQLCLDTLWGLVHNEKIRNLDSFQQDFPRPELEPLAPLAVFQCSAQQGPFTLSNWANDASVPGVVSMPESFASHPVLWAALGHETGGHNLLAVLHEVLPELEQLLQRGYVDPVSRKKYAFAKEWSRWLEESVSDVYAILNYGPAFALSLLLLLSSVHRSTTDNYLDVQPFYVTRRGRKDVDEHPPDNLRMWLAVGAIIGLKGLSPTHKDTHIQRLIEIADAFSSYNPAYDEDYYHLMRQQARELGFLIATWQLEALGGQRIQDLETWTDRDEEAVRKGVTAFINTQTLEDTDPRIIISAATVAIFESHTVHPSRRPFLYSTVNTLLHRSLATLIAPTMLISIPKVVPSMLLRRRPAIVAAPRQPPRSLVPRDRSGSDRDDDANKQPDRLSKLPSRRPLFF